MLLEVSTSQILSTLQSYHNKKQYGTGIKSDIVVNGMEIHPYIQAHKSYCYPTFDKPTTYWRKTSSTIAAAQLDSDM